MTNKEKALEWALKIGYPSIDELVYAAGKLAAYFEDEAVTEYNLQAKYIDKNRIVKAACEVYLTTPEELRVPNRKHNLVRCRFNAATLLKLHTRLTLTEIAKEVGVTDHTSVIHMLKRAEKLLLTDPAFQEKMLEIKSLL